MQINSVCTYCGVGCDISATVQNNKIKSITAKKDGTVSEGKLCIKGKHGFDFVHSFKRLKSVKIKKSFLEKNELFFPIHIKEQINKLKTHKDGFVYPKLELAYEITAWKFNQISSLYGNSSFGAIGGARTNCESGYLFQKFTRDVMNSPNIDNCSRVCHAPSLKGMRLVIGEGAATNPYDDIKKSEFLIIIGSNTTEAHPIVANRVTSAIKNGTDIALFDVRDTALSKLAKYNAILPYEANLLFLNMLSYVIIKEKLFDSEFIKTRTTGFDQYRQKILHDPFANPDFFKKIRGYEYLSTLIPQVAREYATKKSMILWGLGVTEHEDGSYAVAAICNLAIMSGNIGKVGAGLMPLRGQNNVQGACDMGCLPYYDPDYQKPLVDGLTTPGMIDAILEDNLKALFVMGEDIAHVHPNQNKIHKALKKLEFLVVNELFDNEVTSFADVIYGVKSSYEKSGVYINAERRLHLSNPLVNNTLPDDWEVIQGIVRYIDNSFHYKSSEDIWNEVRVKASERFFGASYQKLKENQIQGLQWPIQKDQTKRLHEDTFRTKDGFAHFKYYKYHLRGMIKELLKNRQKDFYLTTGRVLEQYNSVAQTKESQKLIDKYPTDILLVSLEDRDIFDDKISITLVSKYGKSAPLKFKYSKSIKKGTLFVSFHYAKSKINFLFGDESDELTKTAKFKSIKVKIE